MSSYNLIAIRYKEKESDGMMRREFFSFEIDEARAFYKVARKQSKEKDNYKLMHYTKKVQDRENALTCL